MNVWTTHVDKKSISWDVEWTYAYSPCWEKDLTQRGHGDLLNANTDHSKFCKVRL